MISSAEQRRGMDNSIRSAIMSSIFTSAVGGPILSGLMLSLHFSTFQIGLTTAVTLLLPPFQIVGALLQQRYFQRKYFWSVWSRIYYAAYFLLIILTCLWTQIPATAAILLFMMIYGIAQMAAQLPAAIFLAWLGDLTPEAESNSYWSRRQAWTQITVIAASLAVGLLVDLLGRDQTLSYTVVIAGGTLFGWWSYRLQCRVPDPQPQCTFRRSPLRRLQRAWNNEQFRILLFFFAFQSLALWLVGSFFFVYLQQTMKLSMTTIQLLSASSGIIGFLTAIRFRAMGTHYGRKRILFWCSLFKAIELGFWGFLTPDGGWTAALPCFIIGGAVNTGIAIAQMSLLTSMKNTGNKSFSIAVFSAVISLCGFLSAGLSGKIYDRLEHWSSSFQMTPFNILCLTAAVAYLIGLFILRPLQEKTAERIIQ